MVVKLLQFYMSSLKVQLVSLYVPRWLGVCVAGGVINIVR